MALITTERLRSGLADSDGARVLSRSLEQEELTVARLLVARIFLEDSAVELPSSGGVAQAGGQHFCRFNAQVSGHIRRRDVRATQQDLPIFSPLLGFFVDLCESEQGPIVVRFGRHQLSEPGERQIRAQELLGRPTSQLKEQHVPLGGAHLSFDGFSAARQDLFPGGVALAGQALHGGSERIAQRVLAERLRVRDERLLLVFEFVLVELTNLSPMFGALGRALAAFALLEQGFDQLFVLAEGLLDAHECLRGAAVCWIELNEPRVGFFGALVTGGGFVQPRRARQVLLGEAVEIRFALGS